MSKVINESGTIMFLLSSNLFFTNNKVRQYRSIIYVFGVRSFSIFSSKTLGNLLFKASKQPENLPLPVNVFT